MNKTDKLLVIVESPAKAKTVSEILKKSGFTNTNVIASIGHIVKLKDGGPAFNSGIYPDKGFQMNLAIDPEKKKVVDSITAAANTAHKIIIMTDQDRAGFFIGWSVIKFCKLPTEKCVRAVTHEITPKAVIHAVENPVPFNDNLVNAECARMMTDKLIGYGLSPLGKKYMGAKSIGRCQSVGLKLISDREREISEFIPEMYFNLYLTFIKNDISYKAKYCGYKTDVIDKLTKQADVKAIISNCKNTPYTIESVETKTHKESPKPPFCTATFQQEAANVLGLRVKDAMSCAQKLFEGIKVNGEHVGLVTYMRTDSTEIAAEFIPELTQYITNTFGADKYVSPRVAKPKGSEQDGHEALRIVDPNITPDMLATLIDNELLVKVYKLIWQRTIAAAMPSATSLETCYIINNNDHKFKFNLKRLTDAGYKTVYDYNEVLAPNMQATFVTGELLQDTELTFEKLFTQPKARFTEASLVKELQQREIGRPSTYATIVETILSPTRGYAQLEEKHIIPTDRGIQLASYCDRAFPNLINLNYTKSLEATLDKIAEGKIQLLDYMEIFYKNLQDTINSTNETGIATDMPEKSCPICNGPMVVRRSRFGKLFYGCSSYPKCTGIINIQ